MLSRMKAQTRRRFLTQTGLAGAGLAAMGPVAKAEEGKWIDLFDGKTLKGWHKNRKRIGHGTGGTWKAEGGTITGEQDPPGSGNGGILLTDQKFGDFELELDIKPDWGVCSGLFLRGTETGQCFQVMVDYHDAGNVGHIYGEGTGGFNTRPFDIFGKHDGEKKLIGYTTKPNKGAGKVDYSISGEDWAKTYKHDDWNHLKVRCVGKYPKITTWINGTKIIEFDGAKYEAGNYDKEKVAETLGEKGSIAVQVHAGGGWPKGAKCRWKNIKVREIRA
jgi:hypothetical protein